MRRTVDFFRWIGFLIFLALLFYLFNRFHR